MTDRSPRAARPSGPGRDTALKAPSSAASAREVFGRFVRTLEQIDAARGGTASAKEKKAETAQTWEVTGCGKR